MNPQILAAIDDFRNGDDDKALVTLLALAEDIVPGLGAIFDAETDPEVRAFIIRVAWERHEAESANMIVEALNDPAEEVWQAGLDGTVALASPQMLDMLKSIRNSERADPATARRFQLCVDEAILYVDGLVHGGQRQEANFVPLAFKK